MGTRMDSKIKRVESMDTLGTLLTLDSQEAVARRLQKATSAYWKFSEILQAPEVPLERRFHIYTKRVQIVALYGASTWIWTRATCVALKTWGNIMRSIFRVAKSTADSYGGWVRRHTAAAREAFAAKGHQSLLVLGLHQLLRDA